MVSRELVSIVQRYLFTRKTVVVYGARQTGKTTLVHQLVKGRENATLFLNGDDADVRSLLTEVNRDRLTPVIGSYTTLVLDEAQRIPEPDLVLKIIYDAFPQVHCIATGSSSFDLAGAVSEPLTGRKLEYHLYPFSFSEMVHHHGFLTEKRLLPHRIVYGYYPDVALALDTHTGKRLLSSLASSYLYKDLLMLDAVKKPVLLEKILHALAMQLGSEVSYNELAALTGSTRDTVERYIDLLEKAYIVFRLPAFSRNVRNEIRRNRKIYFFDNGIRNALLGRFDPLDTRKDTGALWENFCISERKKYLENNEIDARSRFWRTTQQQEIDYIEERGRQLYAFEFKWNPARRVHISRTFRNAYPNATCDVITPENVHTFLLHNAQE
jgi:hypothetical protein